MTSSHVTPAHGGPYAARFCSFRLCVAVRVPSIEALESSAVWLTRCPGVNSFSSLLLLPFLCVSGSIGV